MKTSLSKTKLSAKELKKLSDKAAKRICFILFHFGYRSNDCGDNVFCPCPIHGGDNPTGFSMNTDESSTYFGNWACWTNHCHEEHINTPIGLIRALMSIKEDREVSFQEAIEYTIKLTETDLETLAKESEDFEFDTCDSKTEREHQKRQRNIDGGVAREKVRSSLVIPPEYYIKRGYTAEVLNQFDVGTCPRAKNPSMRDRVIVPVYDDDFDCMVGHLGRAQHENYHGRKWVNSEGFYTGVWLYGYWLSKPFINKAKSVILVEGQGDVWRLWEAGIKNVVGIFGASLSDAQMRILETSAALTIIPLTDNDEAGIKAKESIKKKCGRMFNIVEVDLPAKDVGELSVSEINKIIKPQIEGLNND